MSVPFTNQATINQKPQSIIYINEIILAINERITAVNAAPHGINTIALREVDDNAQTATFWRTLQQRVESLTQFYLNYTLSSFQNKGDDEIFWPEDTSEWESQTGLAATKVGGVATGIYQDKLSISWRRVTAWDPPSTPSYLFGYAQEDDYFGPWIFEDLINCLNQLWWAVNTGHTAPRERWSRLAWSDSFHFNCDVSYDEQVERWGNSSWVPANPLGDIYSVTAFQRRWESDAPYVEFRGNRVKGKCSQLPWVGLPSEIDVYFKVTGAALGFLDIDNLGATNGTLHFVETLSESQDETRTMTELFGDFSDNPVEAAGYGCPVAGGVLDIEGAVFLEFSGNRWVYKWSVTNGDKP